MSESSLMSLTRCICLTTLVAIMTTLAPLPAVDDIGLDPEIRVQLDEWEGRQLKKAEDIYTGEDKRAAKSNNRYALAATAFESFINEFPRSRAIPYALYMQGRSYHMDNKRNKARVSYDDLIQFFPDDITFATAAAYQKGASLQQDGDEEAAMQAWAIIAKNARYRKQPLAANAIYQLALHAWNKEKLEQAAGFFKDVAIEFMNSNSRAARDSVDKVLEYYIRHKPDEAALRTFYQNTNGFDGRTKKTGDDAAVLASRIYWETLLKRIDRHGRFDDLNAEGRKKYYTYWAGAMQGHHPEWDEYQYDLATFRLRAGGSKEAWQAALDKQYEDYQKPGNNARTLLWMKWLAADEAKLKHYYGKIAWESMQFAQIMQLMALVQKNASTDLISMITARIPLADISDPERATLAQFMYPINPGYTRQVIATMGSADFGNWTLLNLIASDATLPLEERVAVADSLVSSESYAGQASWIKGEMLEAAGQYQQAIPAYLGGPQEQGAGIPFAVARCYMSAGNVDQALSELSVAENLFKKNGSDFALKAAEYQDKAGRRDAHIATMRRILRQYKGDRGAVSKAHQRLEKLGVPMTGGEVIDR